MPVKSNEIFPIHEYGDKTHFKALYDCAADYHYDVKEQIIFRKRYIIKKAIKTIIKNKDLKNGFKQLFCNMFNHFKIRFLKDKIIIVGIAPYDRLLNKYKKVFKKNKSFYFTSHTVWDGSDFPKGSIKNKDAFERILSECFQGAFCVSQTTERQVKNMIPNTSVVNHAIDFQLYKKRIECSDDPVRKYIFAGGFVERKNIMLILRWLKEHPGSNVVVDFAGDGILKKEIEQDSKNDKRIHILGMCSKNQLQKILCEYDFMLLPSKKEPFGICLLESLASGTPCIVSNAIGPNEIIDDCTNGYVFDLKNEYESFCSVMNKSIQLTKAELTTFRHNAVIAGQKYSSESIVKKWMSLIDEERLK